jgi:aromatic ring hydroxylase
MIVFENVFIPQRRIFMDGEVEFAAPLVERFTCYHRRSYVCKSGVGDVLIGAAATIADYNGVERASHIRDKLVEMTHLNETIYGPPAMAERCLRDIARLVRPYGYLLVSGIDLDVRARVAADLGWLPVEELIEEIHEGDPCNRKLWPYHLCRLGASR